MGAGHSKSGSSRMRGNNLLYEIFRGRITGTLSFYETGLGVIFSLRFDLPWMRTTFFPLTYLSHPTGWLS